jgi:hypothetical protein
VGVGGNGVSADVGLNLQLQLPMHAEYPRPKAQTHLAEKGKVLLGVKLKQEAHTTNTIHFPI